MSVALVSGGAGGLGRAAVERLGADGHTVVVADVDERAQEVAAAVGGALGLPLDVRDAGAVRAQVDRVVAELGSLDVVVNCAGTLHRTSFEETTAETFMADVETNLLGTFLVCQAAVFPHMRDAQAGRLINVASGSAYLGGMGRVSADGSGGRSGAGYAASKAGVVNVTRWIAREVGRWGICCNVVVPGTLESPMTQGAANRGQDIPLGRFGKPEEFADAVSWLAGPGATYVHGSVITVDGGLVRA